MTNNDSAGWARRIAENFGKGYTNEQLSDLDAAFSPLSEAEAERLYAHIKQTTRASFKVDLLTINEAKNQLGIIGGPTGEALQFQTVKWICQACAKSFQFNYQPNDGDEYREIFNFCPHCGFVPRVSIYMEGNRLTYIGDAKAIERLRIPNAKGVSTMEYYKSKTKPFFDKARERDSELTLYAEKGIDEDFRRLASSKRFK